MTIEHELLLRMRLRNLEMAEKLAVATKKEIKEAQNLSREERRELKRQVDEDLAGVRKRKEQLEQRRGLTARVFGPGDFGTVEDQVFNERLTQFQSARGILDDVVSGFGEGGVTGLGSLLSGLGEGLTVPFPVIGQIVSAVGTLLPVALRPFEERFERRIQSLIDARLEAVNRRIRTLEDRLRDPIEAGREAARAFREDTLVGLAAARGGWTAAGDAVRRRLP